MILKSAVIDNVLSIGHVEREFGVSGIVRVTGRNEDVESASNNGSGKTSLFEAIMWGVYGQTMRGLSSMGSVPDISWRGRVDKGVQNVYTKGKKNGKARVVTTWYDGESEYQIDRTITSTKLLIDGEQYDRDKLGTEERIFNLFPPIGLFCTMVYIGERGPFRFSGWNAKQRTVAMESLIDFSMYDLAHEYTLSKIKKIKVSIDEAQDEYDEIETSIRVEEGKADTIQENIEELNEKLEVFEETIVENKKYVDNLRAEIDELEQLGDEEDIERSMQEDYKKLDGANAIASDAAKVVHTNESEISRLTKEIEEIKELDDKCPTCMQEISGDFKEDIIGKREAKIEDCRAIVEENEKVHETNTYVANAITKKIREAEAKLRRLSKVSSLRNELKNVEDLTKQSSDSIVGSLNTRVEQLNKIQGKMKKLTSEKGKIGKGLDKLKDELKYYEFWGVGFSSRGIRSYKLDTVLSWLNEDMRKYIDQVFGDDMVVELRPDKELKSGDKRNSIELNVDYNGREYIRLSDSEKAKVNFIVHLGLRDLAEEFSGDKFNVLFLDEVFASFDSVSIEYIKELLKKFSKDIEVYVASHKNEFEFFGDESIIAVKEDGITAFS